MKSNKYPKEINRVLRMACYSALLLGEGDYRFLWKKINADQNAGEQLFREQWGDSHYKCATGALTAPDSASQMAGK